MRRPGQTYGPVAIAPLFNSAMSWCVVAFVAAFGARRPSRAALLGGIAMSEAVCGIVVISDTTPVGYWWTQLAPGAM